MFFVYILNSDKLNRFYIGSTKNLKERLAKHRTHFYGNLNFTSKANDWTLYFHIECLTEKQARKIEVHIKRMKSKTYIENLKKYPELVHKVKDKYSESPVGVYNK
ncbi:MAG: GIY-YIG nuclease family protein [Bacteroidetes bacterium]|nr:GIY-YIG nuclease family protein [Bacteroidota bacterium]